MSEKTLISALFFEETGEAKCGYCGRKLFCLDKNSKKSTKSIDNKNYFGIIKVKCDRCKNENTLKI